MSSGVKLNPFEQARLRPDTYIGSVVTEEREVYVYSDETKTAELKEVVYNDGLYNIVREIISNSIDNVWRSQTTSGSPPVTYISIAVDTEAESITVKNDGYCIPAEKRTYKHKNHRTGKTIVEKMYPAEMFFGDMLVSTNYDDTIVRKTSGRNGMGGKASNIFCKKFVVEHVDPKAGMKFVQVYTDGGKKRTKPKVTVSKVKKGYTSITLFPDFEYFSFPSEEEHFLTQDFVDILILYAFEVAMIAKVNVKFSVDGEAKSIKMPNMGRYARLFYPSTKENHVATFTAPNGDECLFVEHSSPEGVETLQQVNHFSFVNGIRTFSGGVHVDAFQKAIFPVLVRELNKKLATGAPKGVNMKVSAKDVFPYLTMFLRTEVDRPEFGSQTKDRLTKIKSEDGEKTIYKPFNARKVTEKKAWSEDLNALVKKMLGWNFVKSIKEKLLLKAGKSLQKVEKVRRNPPLSSKVTDAYFAGGKHFEKASLFITEGDSAKTFIEEGIAKVPEGGDRYGVFPVKGKPLNTTKASAQAIAKNIEIQEIKKVLGLRRGVDYSDEKVYRTLRYGHVIIAADSDDDGKHIQGLLLNFFYSFPGLIERGFVQSFSTAVVVARYGDVRTSKKEPKLFFSNPEAEKWLSETGGIVKVGKSTKKLTIDYQKGLGSIPRQDVGLYFTNPRIITYHLHGDEDKFMELGFGKETSNDRKKWICKGLPSITGDDDEATVAIEETEESEPTEGSDDEIDYANIYEGELPVSKFVDHQLIVYCRCTIGRALPNVIDGFKISQRKVFYSCRKMVLGKDSYKGVSEVCGVVKAEATYHHGEASLEGVIVGMAQGFVGSNNIPLLVEYGQFGSRTAGGKDSASSRYISTRLERIANAIFPRIDDNLLDRVEDCGILCEVGNYYPVIPMLLANGSSGIATGYSTTIPQYNPKDLSNWIREWLSNDCDSTGIDALVPWWRGFTGKVEIFTDTKGNQGWVTKGRLFKHPNATKAKQGWWVVDELPIGLWTQKFKDYLHYLQYGRVEADKKEKEKSYLATWEKSDKIVPGSILAYRNERTSTNRVHYEFRCAPGFVPTMKSNFSMLITTGKFTNMHAVDSNFRPYRFDTPEGIMEVFCMERLKLYSKRRRYLIKLNKHLYLKAHNRYRFVKGVVDGELDVNGPKTDEGVDELLEGEPWLFDKLQNDKEAKKVSDEYMEVKKSYDYLLSMPMRSMTTKRLEALKKEYENIKKEIRRLKKLTNVDMWLTDLDHFDEEYARFLKERNDG